MGIFDFHPFLPEKNIDKKFIFIVYNWNHIIN